MINSTIQPVEVKRNQEGYWTHPEFEKFCGDREFISTAEFDAWAKANGLEWTAEYCEEALSDSSDSYGLSEWNVEMPESEGWFCGSIHDTEDGYVCIWLRHAAQEVE
ncbi:hypothetical protein [Hafnia paralvei]|uniref:hypothetical protein n=1 Tax=Hafnia paralvei TaxID=546367 RepID=UPI000BB55B1C|nr:hypothetical protein [Hafnia paralvei]PNK67515.1 hypothetical protein A6J69_010930 [Hafnia paralvei]